MGKAKRSKGLTQSLRVVPKAKKGFRQWNESAWRIKKCLQKQLHQNSCPVEFKCGPDFGGQWKLDKERVLQLISDLDNQVSNCAAVKELSDSSQRPRVPRVYMEGGDTVQAFPPLLFFSFFLSVLHFQIQFSGEAWARAGLQGWVIGRMPRSRMGLAARSDLDTAVLCLGTRSPCLPRVAPIS